MPGAVALHDRFRVTRSAGCQTSDVSGLSTSIVDALDDAILDALARLLPQVSNSAASLTRERVETVLAEPSTHLVVARLADLVVGMALLCVCTTLKGQFGLVEEVAVDEKARGSHVGVHLMVTLLEHELPPVGRTPSLRRRWSPLEGCSRCPVHTRRSSVSALLSWLGSREKPVAQIAEDLGISDRCLRDWMRQADIDEGRREGLSER